MSPVVVFVGPMAAGKTKVGKRVARLLDIGFVDTDKVIVAEHGPISDIFAEHGEPYFRRLERATVSEALSTAGVVSLGGGAILDADTRAELRTEPVVFLTVAADVVARRLALQAGKRPLATGGRAQWEQIFATRQPLYEEVASTVIDTSHGDFSRIAREVVEWLTP